MKATHAQLCKECFSATNWKMTIYKCFAILIGTVTVLPSSPFPRPTLFSIHFCVRSVFFTCLYLYLTNPMNAKECAEQRATAATAEAVKMLTR